MLAKNLEMTTDQWKDVLRQAADHGALYVRFTGGEPLLRDDFAELYLFTRRLGMKVMLFTNGCLITSDLADLFARVPPLKMIEVSVYGMQPKSYDAVTCAPGAFREFRSGVELLSERQIPFVVKSVILPHNRDELGQFETWAATIPWMSKSPAYAQFFYFRTRRDSDAKNRLISSLRFTPEEGLKMLIQLAPNYISEMAQFCGQFIRPASDQLFTCGAGEVGCVDAYGKYQMCMLLRHPDFVYDLTRGTLRQALMGEFRQWRELRATNQEYIRRCARCFLKGLCEQCPGRSWSEYGTLDTPVEYLCDFAHVQARYLGLLKENEYGWEVENWRERIAALVERANSMI